MWAQILCYKNQGIHWYHCNPTFLWQINFRLVRRLISALIWDISGLWNRSDSRDYREKRIAISRFLALYKNLNTSIFHQELASNSIMSQIIRVYFPIAPYAIKYVKVCQFRSCSISETLRDRTEIQFFDSTYNKNQRRLLIII